MNIVLSTTADELYYCESKTEVSFEIEETPELNDIVDGIRIRNGFIPFFADRMEVWDNGWYDFYLRINPQTEKVLDIDCVVIGNDADENICPDNNKYYHLGEYVSLDGVMEQLVAQLRQHDITLEDIRKEIDEDL